MSSVDRIASVAALAALLLAACEPRTATESAPVRDAITPPEMDLANASYEGIYDEPIRLADGRFEGEPFQPGAASRPTVTLLPEPVTFGDFDGDGISEGVAVLLEHSGGSGSFVYLAVVTGSQGDPRSLATVLVGDRAEVTAIELDGSTIVVTVVAPGPGEPRSAPGTRTVRRWELLDGALVETTPP